MGDHPGGDHPPHAEDLADDVRGVIGHSSRDAEIGKHSDIILGFQTTLGAPSSDWNEQESVGSCI